MKQIQHHKSVCFPEFHLYISRQGGRQFGIIYVQVTHRVSVFRQEMQQLPFVYFSSRLTWKCLPGKCHAHFTTRVSSVKETARLPCFCPDSLYSCCVCQIKGIWSSLCGRHMGPADARVLCASKGYSRGSILGGNVSSQRNVNVTWTYKQSRLQAKSAALPHETCFSSCNKAATKV